MKSNSKFRTKSNCRLQKLSKYFRAFPGNPNTYAACFIHHFITESHKWSTVVNGPRHLTYAISGKTNIKSTT